MDANTSMACDVLVVGSGSGGLATAISARMQGLDVLVVEKEDYLGGGTAFSYGTCWVPCNPVAAREGIKDDREAARTYLRHEMGAHYDDERISAYLEYGPRVIEFFETQTAVRFLCRDDYPDYHSEFPGALEGGRTIFTAPYDGRELGPVIDRLRPPLPTQTIMGMMYTPKEVKSFQTWARSRKSFLHVGGRLLRHWRDSLVYGRTMWLTNGNALAARLIKTATELEIPMSVASTVRGLVVRDGRVCGARVEVAGREVVVEARKGVVLACGGFGHDLKRCQDLFARPQLDGQSWSMAPEGNTGDGLTLGESVGGRVNSNLRNTGFWSPASRVPDLGGMLAGHYHDRQRPGFIAVNRHGRRFANEALSYHHFGEAIVQACEPGEQPYAYLISDQRSLRRTGCGTAILPRPFPLGRHLRSGYLIRGESVADLAQKIGVDAAVLEQSLAEFNTQARAGRDLRFGKGDTAFNRYFGDTTHGPNVCLGPLETPPYYAVKITAAHMSTLAGLDSDVYGRVLDAVGAPIPGLYAAGNDAGNLFRGACPGGGITLGPNLTFGYITGLHLAGVAVDLPRAATPAPVQKEALIPA